MEAYIFNVAVNWISSTLPLTLVLIVVWAIARRYYNKTKRLRGVDETKVVQKTLRKNVFQVWLALSLVILGVVSIQSSRTFKNEVKRNPVAIIEEKNLDIIPVPSIMEKAKENHSFEDSLWEGVRNN